MYCKISIHVKVVKYLFKDMIFDSFIYILREKSLAIIYNGVSHWRSLKHTIFLIGMFANLSVV